MKSSFTSDLKKEKKLSILLDSYYSNCLKQYDFERVHNLQKQLQGIDVVFKHKTARKTFLIDEKAQLDYINEDLPTFAFELHYIKNSQIKDGWLYDTSKKTDFYALVTAIYEDEPDKYTSCKIIFVNRNKLKDFLAVRGISKQLLLKHYQREGLPHGKLELKELKSKTEGYLYHSKNNKTEQPFNLILRLDWLLSNDIAKKLI